MTRRPRMWLLAILATTACGSGALRDDDLSATAEEAVLPMGSVDAYVDIGSLNLRTGPSTSYRTLRALGPGTTVSVVGTANDWLRVISSGTTGYVNSWDIHLKGMPSTVIRQGNPDRKRIALTFDVGADVGYTEAILQTLAAEDVSASFGLTGAWIQGNPTYAMKIVDSGFQILNQTQNHASFTGESIGGHSISAARRLSQLSAAEGRIVELSGVTSKPYWRPPYGDYDKSVLVDVGAAGYTKTVLWSIDTLGRTGASADAIYARVVDNAQNGSIVLMHLGSDSLDAVALPRIIATLRERGYSFGTIAHVLAP